MNKSRAELEKTSMEEEIFLIKDKTVRLLSLLSHPEPGLITWVAGVGNLLYELGQHLPDISLEMLLEEREELLKLIVENRIKLSKEKKLIDNWMKEAEHK